MSVLPADEWSTKTGCYWSISCVEVSFAEQFTLRLAYYKCWGFITLKSHFIPLALSLIVTFVSWEKVSNSGLCRSGPWTPIRMTRPASMWFLTAIVVVLKPLTQIRQSFFAWIYHYNFFDSIGDVKEEFNEDGRLKFSAVRILFHLTCHEAPILFTQEIDSNTMIYWYVTYHMQHTICKISYVTYVAYDMQLILKKGSRKIMDGQNTW